MWCFLWNEREIPLPRWRRIWPTHYMSNGIQRLTLLWMFLLELEKHRKKAILMSFKANFCSSIICFNATGQSRATQVGSWPRYLKSATIDQIIANFRVCQPWPFGPWACHPCRLQIKIIITWYQRCFPCFGNHSILDWPMLVIFQIRKFLSYVSLEHSVLA